MLIGGFVCVLQYRDHQQTCLTTRSNTRKYLKISFQRNNVSEIHYISIFNILDIPSSTFLISFLETRLSFSFELSPFFFLHNFFVVEVKRFEILAKSREREGEREKEKQVRRGGLISWKLRKSTCIELKRNIHEIGRERRGYIFSRVWVNKLSEYILFIWPSKRHIETCRR